jgi:hypothetical protein
VYKAAFEETVELVLLVVLLTVPVELVLLLPLTTESLVTVVVMVVVLTEEGVVTVSTTVLAATDPPKGTTWFRAYPEMKKSKKRRIMTRPFAKLRVLLEELNICYFP